MKKALVLMMVLALVAVLAGCTQSAPAPTAAPEAAVTEAPAAEAPAAEATEAPAAEAPAAEATEAPAAG